MAALGAGLLAGLWSATRVPVYQATAEVTLASSDDVVAAGQARLVEASRDLAGATAAAVPGVSTSDVLDAVTVDRVGNVLTVAATSHNPALARDVANAHTAAYSQLLDAGVPPGSEVIATAEVPTAPISPWPARDVAVGAALGLVAGGGAGLVRDRRGRGLTTARLERAGRTVLAELPIEEADGDRNRGLVTAETPDGETATMVRSLCDQLTGRRDDAHHRVLITGAAGEGGKSMVAANLAWVAATKGLRTVLVGGDAKRLRVERLLEPYLVAIGHRPSSNAVTWPAASSGREGIDRLTAAVAGDHLVANLAPTTSDNLCLLPALPGATDDAPGAMLGSGVVSTLFDHLDLVADLVVIDGPSLSDIEETRALYSAADVIVVVAMAGSRSTHRLERAVADLGDGARPRVRWVVVSADLCRGRSQSSTSARRGDHRRDRRGRARATSHHAGRRGTIRGRFGGRRASASGSSA